MPSEEQPVSDFGPYYLRICCQCDSEGTGIEGRKCAFCLHEFCRKCPAERIGR